MAITIKFENKCKRRVTVDDLRNGNIFIYDNTPFMLLVNGGDYGYYYVDKEDKESGRIECELFAVNLLQGEIRDFYGSEEVSLITKDLEIKIDRDDIKEWI